LNRPGLTVIDHRLRTPGKTAKKAGELPLWAKIRARRPGF